jgi:uncharacterized membrane protein
MSALNLFHWIAHTSLGVALRDSTWAFAAIEVVHLLALALFGGAVLLVDLRFLGVGMKTQSITEVVRGLAPQLIGGLSVMVVTGVLMVWSGPMRYYYNTAFRAKMGLFLVGALLQFIIHAAATRRDSETLRWSKGAAILSIAIWLSVALAGRAIGYV